MSTISARSGNLADVQAAVRSAKEGDTVTIPTGTYTWNQRLNIDGGTYSDGSERGKSINLVGEGGVTVLNNYKISNTWADQDLIVLRTSPAANAQIRGINFEEGPALAGSGSIGHCFAKVFYRSGWGQGSQAANVGKPVLIDGCNFIGKGNISHFVAPKHHGGVIANCRFAARGTGSEVGVHWQGEGSWRQPSSWGRLDTSGLRNWYVEDCVFESFLFGYAFDVSAGARMVIRHNKFISSLIGSHGLETDPQGMRHAEVYNNSFSGAGTYCWIHMRGGSWVVTGNTFDAGPGSAVIMTIIALHRRAVAFSPPCPTRYPMPRQVGQGWSGGAGSFSYPGYEGLGDGNITEPIHIWGNTSRVGNLVGFTEDQDTCGNRLKIQDFVKVDRDYILSAKPNYTPFTYPHPLRAGTTPPPEPPPPPPPPMSDAPVLTQLLAQGANSVRVTWTSAASPVTGQWFRIFWGRESTRYTAQADAEDVRTRTVSGLAQGKWYFMVRRFISGSSAVLQSNEMSVEVGEAPPPPPPPPPEPEPITYNISGTLDRAGESLSFSGSIKLQR